ncbi:MAG: aminopeptidase [Aerococcus sp.]|nr:aminopeptidase [Aerococcus sp.]
MENFDSYLAKYAQLLIQMGLQIKPGDNVMIYIAVDQLPLARLLQEEAYKAGAKRVHFTWNDDTLARNRYHYEEVDTLTENPDYEQARRKDLIENQKICRISVLSSDPDSLSGLDHDKLQKAQKATILARKLVMNATMRNDIKWNVAAAASYGWAKHIFPEYAEDPEKCVDALWDSIFQANRVYEDDPVQAWKDHMANLKKRADQMNNFQFDKLHYQAPGTDFTVGLPKNHIWAGGDSVSADGDTFVANMPTEEIFTAPDTNRLDGVIVSTKPLAYQNQTIIGIRMECHDGQITDITAEQGAEIMKNLVNNNKGAHGLGEVALVPHHSPISDSNLTFYQTLFDENASCHIAIGAAYPHNVAGTKDDDEETLLKKGVNVSDVHVDFMVGSDKMNIDGITKDGEVVPVFRNGEWAI